MIAGGLLVVAAAVFVEGKIASEPVIPLNLFKDRTIALATIAATLVGITMMSATTFLSEYFQMARGMTPTRAGLMSLAMVVGLMWISITAGRFITKTGRWKMWLVGGMATTAAGAALMSTINATTPLWHVGGFMFVLGCGIGATQQNLVLAVQNNVNQANIGAASSVVAFFRTLGGAIGVSARGGILSHRVSVHVTDGVTPLAVQCHDQGYAGANQQLCGQLGSFGHGSLPNVRELVPQLATIFEHAFGRATGQIFMFTVPCAVLALITVVFIKENRLRTTLDKLEGPETGMELAAELEIGQRASKIVER
jgi:hypothetical protein